MSSSSTRRARRATPAVVAFLALALAIPARAQTHLDNPFVGAKMYVNPEFTANAEAVAAATADANLALRMRSAGHQPTAIWLDRIAAVPSMATHLDRALETGSTLAVFVLRDLPGRDCDALSSNGEMVLSSAGLARYETEFIDAIAAIARQSKYADLRIVFVVEPDTIVNLITNLSYPDCAYVQSSGLYAQGIQYAVNTLHAIPNVYLYLDLAHAAWLGWSNNSTGMVSYLGTLSSGFTAGKSALDGFVTNDSAFIPLREPFFTGTTAVGGKQVMTSKFYEYNPDVDDATFAADLWARLTAAGWPTSLGVIADTSRNGWGGPQRPKQPSTQSIDLDKFVNESKVDRRAHRNLWCNPAGAGLGEVPQAAPAGYASSHYDAFFWVKTPGVSDGAAIEDRSCEPGWTTPYNVATGALPDAPRSGQWFPAQFTELVQNQWPQLAVDPDFYPLTVTFDSGGTVTSSPSGIACGASCSALYVAGAVVTLTAVQTGMGPLAAWGGACSGSSPTCVLTMDGPKSVSTTWFGDMPTLNVARAGTGTGVVTSSPGGISCGSSCSMSVSAGTTVTLTATASAGSTFTGWSGSCTGASPTCVVTMTSMLRTVTASFTSLYATLTVNKLGTGFGSVGGVGSGISVCDRICTYSIPINTTYILSATASPGSVFKGWGGACANAGTYCQLTVTGDTVVNATFDLGVTLTVVNAGTGLGTVTSAQYGISCGTYCSATLAPATVVTLTASAAPDSTFAGWSGGGCSGTAPTCAVTLAQATTVTATFQTKPVGPCANATTFSWNTGNFNTTGAVCYRTSQKVSGWGCSNFAGRTVSLNGGTPTATCGAGPFPLPKSSDGYTYFTITAGQYPWASIYVW